MLIEFKPTYFFQLKIKNILKVMLYFKNGKIEYYEMKNLIFAMIEYCI